MVYRLSPNSLNLYEDCVRCFYEKVKENKDRPSGPFSSLPSGMDSTLKKWYDSHRKDGSLPQELENLGAVLYNGPNLSDWRNNFRGFRWLDKKKNVLHGAIDDLLQFSDGTFAVLDHKTRGFNLKTDTVGHYQFQMDIYTFLGEKNGLDMRGEAYLSFWIPKSIRTGGLVRFSRELVRLEVNPARVPAIFKEAVKVLDGKKPDFSKDCGFCKYRLV